MENPLAWNEVEKTIDRAIRDWYTVNREQPERVGGSMILAIYTALKQGGFLRESQ